MWPWYLLLVMLAALVGGGAWWLSTGKDAAPPVLTAEESLPIPVTRQDIAEPLPEAAGEAVEPLVEAPAAPSASSEARTATKVTDRGADRPSSRVREAAKAKRQSLPRNKPATEPPITGPVPTAVHHTQLDRGRVVQLGAFPTQAQAESSWRKIKRRYPYLATKQKMVNTVDVRGLGGGRPTRMYRLQLGTSSQAQSVVICQQLERAGHSCVVVY
jgi:hypothetical protein